MTDPKRWIDDGAPEAVRALLVAASAEQPGDAATERTLAALGAGSALAAGARSAAGASLARGAASLPALKSAGAVGQVTLALKWGLVGVAAALGAAGAVHEVLQKASPAASHAGAPTRTAKAGAEATHGALTPASEGTTTLPAQGTDAPASIPTSVASAVVPGPRPTHGESMSRVASAGEPPRPTEPNAAAVASSSATASELLAEVSVIDEARAAALRGDAARTLALLDGYAMNFKARRFEPEALYLRMEALGTAGDLDGQRRAAEHLLAQFPSSPQTARARAVLDAKH